MYIKVTDKEIINIKDIVYVSVDSPKINVVFRNSKCIDLIYKDHRTCMKYFDMIGQKLNYVKVESKLSKPDKTIFEKFWSLYKKGNKESAMAIWTTLTDKEQHSAIDSVPQYKKDKEFRYIQNADRYLKEKTFEQFLEKEYILQYW